MAVLTRTTRVATEQVVPGEPGAGPGDRGALLGNEAPDERLFIATRASFRTSRARNSRQGIEPSGRTKWVWVSPSCRAFAFISATKSETSPAVGRQRKGGVVARWISAAARRSRTLSSSTRRWTLDSPPRGGLAHGHQVTGPLALEHDDGGHQLRVLAIGVSFAFRSETTSPAPVATRTARALDDGG